MSVRKHPVFAAVHEAMQSAEELGGCEEEDYAPLMQAIEAEARTRRRAFLESREGPAPGQLLVYLCIVSALAVYGAVDLLAMLARAVQGPVL